MCKFFAYSILTLGLFACGSHEPFDIGNNSSSDADATASDTGRGDVAPAVSGTSCLNRCGNFNDKAACQCDDKCVDSGDCCGDFIKQCAVISKPTPDAGSSAEVVQQNTNPCVDNDGDGWCATSPQPGDCNDNDKKINPKADEVCDSNGTGNGIDENCNGTKDEGCKATVSNPAPTVNNVLMVKYPDSASRRLSWGVTSEKSSIPYVWNAQPWATSDTFTADLGNIQEPASKCLYVRFNVDEPGQHWLCEGNTAASAHLNSAATLSLSLLGKSHTSASTIVLGGGCSAIFVLAFGNVNCTP